MTPEPFRRDDEVTITLTGRVVYASAGRVWVEYIKSNGFPERIAVEVDAPSVTVVPAPAPDDAEKAKRVYAHQRVADAYVGDPKSKTRLLAAIPYQAKETS